MLEPALKWLTKLLMISAIVTLVPTKIAQAQEDHLIFMYADLEPYVIVKDDQATGFLADYLVDLTTSADIEILWRHIHWDRQLPLIKGNEGSLCAIALYKTEERQTFMRFTEPIGADEGLVLIGAENNQKLLSHRRFENVLNDSNLSPVLQLYAVYSPYVNELIKGKNLPLTTGSLERIGRMIKSGKHDYMILARPSAIYMHNNFGIQIYDHYSDLADKVPYHVACNMMVNMSAFDRLNAAIKRRGMAQHPDN